MLTFKKLPGEDPGPPLRSVKERTRSTQSERGASNAGRRKERAGKRKGGEGPLPQNLRTQLEFLLAPQRVSTIGLHALFLDSNGNTDWYHSFIHSFIQKFL